MSNGSAPPRDALDDKVNRLFAGKVVRKDLVRKVKVGANVPVFVLEFLLEKYCASSDELAIQMGLQVVNDTLANNYIRPDESAKAQSKVKENGKYSFVDKVKVRLVDSDYWAEAVNFNNKFLHVPNQRAGSVCLRLRLSRFLPWLCCNRGWLQRSEVGLIRRPPVKARMGPSGIVKAVDISADGGPCLRDTGVGPQIHLLVFEQ